MRELSAREEADVVLTHLGLAPLMEHVVNCAKVLFDTETVDYEISPDQEAGPSTPSTLCIRPHVKPDADHATLHKSNQMLHRFIELFSHQLDMMC